MILEPPVLVGSEYTLRCHVTHVFPVGLLVVTLRRGGRVIYSESLERFTGLDLANVTLTYVLPTKPRDFGLPVTCHARLNLDGLVIRSSSAPMNLTAFGKVSLQSWGLEKSRREWPTAELCAGRHTLVCSVPNSHRLPAAWHPASRALAFTSIAALVGILLVVGAAYLRKCLLMKTQA